MLAPVRRRATAWRCGRSSIAAVNRYLADEVDGALWYGHADMQTGKRTETDLRRARCVLPGLLALSGDMPRAARLQASSLRMWNMHGIEPEVYDYRSGAIPYPGYALRPEIVESTYVLGPLHP